MTDPSHGRPRAPRTLLGAGLLLLLSGAAHAFLGWPALRHELLAGSTAPATFRAVEVGWLYGSAAMFAFGLIALVAWWSLRSGTPVASRVIGIVGALYAGFGAWAYFVTARSPHFLAFIALGILLGAATFSTLRMESR